MSSSFPVVTPRFSFGGGATATPQQQQQLFGSRVPLSEQQVQPQFFQFAPPTQQQQPRHTGNQQQGGGEFALDVAVLSHLEKQGLSDPADRGQAKELLRLLEGLLQPAEADRYRAHAQQLVRVTELQQQQDWYVLEVALGTGTTATGSHVSMLRHLEPLVRQQPDAVRDLRVVWPSSSPSALCLQLEVFRQERRRLREGNLRAPSFSLGQPYRGIGVLQQELHGVSLHPQDEHALWQACYLVYNMCEDLPQLTFGLRAEEIGEGNGRRQYRLHFNGVRSVSYSFLEHLTELLMPNLLDCCMRERLGGQHRLTLKLRSASSDGSLFPGRLSPVARRTYALALPYVPSFSSGGLSLPPPPAPAASSFLDGLLDRVWRRHRGRKTPEQSPTGRSSLVEEEDGVPEERPSDQQQRSQKRQRL